MSEWKEYCIEEIADIISERTDINNANINNYISTENMINDFGGVRAAETLPKSNTVNTFQEGDILFSNIRTYFKKVWYSKFSGTVSPDVLVFRAKNVNNKFLYYLLCNPDFTEYTILTSRGAKMPRGGKGDPAIAQEQAVTLMLEKIEVISNMLHGFPYEDYFESDTSKKLNTILAAEEYNLGLDDGKKRFINEVVALSKSFAIAIPHDQAMDAKDEVAFFQAVKARRAKFDSAGGGHSNEELETTIRQVIDKALVSEQVIDIFDAAGLKKPDISILSEEFLLELKGMEHKNIALEVLKKLLNDEIKNRAKKNLVKSKSLMEMLESSIRKYHNKILTASEVIEELISLSKDITAMDDEANAGNRNCIEAGGNDS